MLRPPTDVGDVSILIAFARAHFNFPLYCHHCNEFSIRLVIIFQNKSSGIQLNNKVFFYFCFLTIHSLYICKILIQKYIDMRRTNEKFRDRIRSNLLFFYQLWLLAYAAVYTKEDPLGGPPS